MTAKVFGVLICLICLLCLWGCEAAPAPATVPTTVPVETTLPQTLPTEPVSPWELAYREILTDYSETVEFRLSPTFGDDYNDGKEIPLSDGLKEALNSDLAYNWHCMLVEMVWSDEGEVTEKEAYGYALEDISDDGIPELFWLRQDGFLLAVFTFREDQAVLLDAFWPRYRGCITPENLLYTRGSGGATHTEFVIRSLGADGLLTDTALFGIDGNKYYEFVDGAGKNITKNRFDELLEQNPFEQNRNWEILPLEYTN